MLVEELITFPWKSSHKTLSVAANAIFPKLFFLAGSKDYVIMLALHLFIHLFVS